MRERLFQAADLGKHRALLALDLGDLSREGALVGASALDGFVCLGNPLDRMVEHGRKVRFEPGELAYTTLALERARRIARPRTRAHPRPGAHARAIRRHIDHARDGRRGKGLIDGLDHIDTAQKARDGARIPIFDRKTVEQTIAGSSVHGLAGRGGLGNEQGLARRRSRIGRGMPRSHERLGIVEHKGIDIVGKQRFNQALELLGSLDDVAETIDDVVTHGARHARDERRAVGHAGVELFQARELGAHLGELGAGRGLARPQLVERAQGNLRGLASLSRALLGILEVGIEFVGAPATALERGRHLLGCGLELLQARGVHIVLDLGIGERVANLGELERSVVDDLLSRALLTRELADLGIELAATRAKILGRRRKLGNVTLGDLERGLDLVELRSRALELLGHALAPMLGARELPAHVGETRNHVAPLLLEQAHIGVDAPHGVLHAAALLAEITDKKAFFLEHNLQLLELALLFALAITGELECGRRLFRGGLERLPLFLQTAQLVDGQDLRELVRAGRKLLVFAGAIDLTLERAQLARDLLIDIAGAREMLVHRPDLFERALFATLVL